MMHGVTGKAATSFSFSQRVKNHVERESLREEINNNSQEITKSEKRLGEKTDKYWTRNFSRMRQEEEESEK